MKDKAGGDKEHSVIDRIGGDKTLASIANMILLLLLL